MTMAHRVQPHRRMRVRDVMTWPAATIGKDDSVHLAARRMLAAEVGALPVTDGDQLVGMITDRDITVRVTAESRDPERTRVAEVMTPRVVTCRDDLPVGDAARTMVHNGVRRLAVLDAAGRLIGVVSVDDLAVAAADEGVSELIPPTQPIH
jgi:CBS domain-containing protein